MAYGLQSSCAMYLPWVPPRTCTSVRLRGTGFTPDGVSAGFAAAAGAAGAAPAFGLPAGAAGAAVGAAGAAAAAGAAVAAGAAGLAGSAGFAGAAGACAPHAASSDVPLTDAPTIRARLRKRRRLV